MTVRKWRTEKTVNATTTGFQWHSDVAALNDGVYVIVWEDQTAALIRGQIFNADGSARTGELVLSGANSSEPDVTADAGGGFWVGYTQVVLGSESAAARGYNETGGGQINVTIAATSDSENQVAVSGLPGGGLVSAYHNSDSTAGDVALYFPATTLRITLLAAGDQYKPDVETLSNGNIVLAWNNADSTIGMQLFDPDGDSITVDAAINGFPINTEDLPKIAALAGGRFVIVYDTFGTAFDPGAGVAGTLFNANGSIAGYVNLNAFTDGSQYAPEVIGTRDGGFVAVWISGSDAGSEVQIRGQAFDALGNRSGSEFVVSTMPIDSFYLPLNLSLALLSDGRIVVTWDGQYLFGNGPDSSGTSVHSQIIDPRDGLVNGTPAAETLYGHDTMGDEINAFTGADTLWGLGGNDNLFGGNDNDALYGGKGDDVLYGGNGNDVLTGDAGDDDLFGEDGVDDMRGGAGADACDGGGGIDIANYSSALTSVTVSLDGSLAGTGDAAGDTFTAVEDVRGANVAGAGDTIRGNSGGNSLSGNAGNDALNGRAGNDKLIGGTGTDTLTGELGNDQFIYNATSEGGDTVTDFTSNAAGNNDVFKFKGSAFGGLPSGALLANQFQSSTSNVAADANVRFFYETDTRILRFDADGSGAVSAPVVMSTLQAGATVTIDDISIF